MNETIRAGWTPTPELRWNYDVDGPPVLQQLMPRDGYEPVWATIPGYRRPFSANSPPSATKREAAEVLAKKIVLYLLRVGTDTTLGTPTRLAFKYRDASDQEREGGGFGRAFVNTRDSQGDTVGRVIL